MALRILRLGSPRHPKEGLRIGTVRRPPRGVPRAEFATQDWYDVWFPSLSPSPELFAKARASTTEREWAAFKKAFRAEMDLLAALSHTTDFSIGCYCESEARCHRSVLRELLAERGAKLAGG
jgi:uncharacterized protein YeaO (DUF488 family)